MKVTLALLCLAILVLPTSARPIDQIGSSTSRPGVRGQRQNVLFWFDDMESGQDGWTHGDLTASCEPQFHVDTYHAHSGGAYSYWCGRHDASFAGGDGYGNVWDQRLVLPPIDVGGTVVEDVSWGRLKAMFGGAYAGRGEGPAAPLSLPLLTFDYRHDSEPRCDVAWLEVQTADGWTRPNDIGYSGLSNGWQSTAAGDYDLSGYGDPIHLRFRFQSDGSCSDEDGLYNSDGGAFQVDNISVFDFATGEIYFSDDCEDGVGSCDPSVPPPAGDWWHIIDRPCPAMSDPHSWWCGDDSDTSHLPPGLNNWLRSPVIDLGLALSCTVHFAIHMALPASDGDFVEFRGTCDGVNYYSFGLFMGDSYECAEWATDPLHPGYDVGQFAPVFPDRAGFMFVLHTTDNGAGPGAAGDAGVMIDDFWMEGYVPY